MVCIRQTLNVLSETAANDSSYWKKAGGERGVRIYSIFVSVNGIAPAVPEFSNDGKDATLNICH